MTEAEIWLTIGILWSGVIAGYLGFLCSTRMLAILQQERYSGKAFLRWYCRKNNLLPRRLNLLALALALLTALFGLCFSFLSVPFANLVSAIPFVGLFLLYDYSERRYALKVPLKNTPRAVRLGVCHFVVIFAFTALVSWALAAIAGAIDVRVVSLLRFLPLALLPLALPFLLAFSNLIMKGYEIPHGRKFVKRATAALDGSDCVKIGITGSCGKTTVKNLVAKILSEKYRVIATPASYNTPLGIASAINANGLDCDVFIAEMGARKTGDIAELCDMVRPDYAIVTSVLPQHLETFGSVGAIAAEKGVLAARAGKGCVIGETAFGAGVSAANALVYGRDFAAEDVRLSTDGASFNLRLPSGGLRVQTALLGRHAAEDVAMAAALCFMLGMTAEEIAAGIGTIEQIPHRLQKSAGANGLVILDDSYNSNVAGAANAVETLRLFDGKKAVITPGLVELGAIEEAENEKLGASFVGLDRVILVGETLVLAVRKGYLNAGGDEDKLVVVPTLEKAAALVGQEFGEGDCVLFLNDLPDSYA